jgi:hypothetical protein
MTITLSAGRVTANERVILTGVPGEVQAEEDPSGHGLFLTARAQSPSSRHSFTLGGIPALGERGFELFTMVPIERGFAPIGLAEKFNSAGAIARVSWTDERQCELTLRDGGAFLAYSARKPAGVAVDGKPAEYTHDHPSGLLRARVAEGGRRILRVRW